MSEWLTPKTNWIASDYININDLNRISSNLSYLKELAELMYQPFPDWKKMNLNKTYQDIQEVSDWNNIEDNLQYLAEYSYPAASGKQMTFYENGSTIDYMELNRIEESILQFYTILKGQYESLSVLAFTLNGNEFD